MRVRFLASLALACVAAASGARAQDVGTKVPEIRLEGFAQTKAASFDDYLGRAVLLEFFAYW